MNVLITRNKNKKLKTYYPTNNFQYINFNKKKLIFDKIFIKFTRKSFKIEFILNKTSFDNNMIDGYNDYEIKSQNENYKGKEVVRITININEEILNRQWTNINVTQFIRITREKTNSSIVLIQNNINILEDYNFHYILNDTYHKISSSFIFEYNTTNLKIIKIVISPLKLLSNFDTINSVNINDAKDPFTNFLSYNDFIIAIENLNNTNEIVINNFFPHPFLDTDFTIKILDQDDQLAKIDSITLILKPPLINI